MPKPIASLSLDLDNKWSYMKTHGDKGWEAFPSYLDVICPRVIDIFAQRDIKITFFVVGQDAALKKNHNALRSLAEAGHEIGNHSFHHEPWLHLYTPDQIAEELQRAQDSIGEATGYRTVGFRGPGFSVTPTVVETLDRMGYAYDCSTFPTFLGPLARAYYFMSSDLDREELKQRKMLFGKFSEGFRTLRPHRLRDEQSRIVRIPVTTMPILKIPIHLSYVLYLGQRSPLLAKSYFRFAMTMCRLARVQPSLLLHPLDFLGADDDGDLAFFPAMGMDLSRKLKLAGEILDIYRSRYNVVPMLEHARHADAILPSAQPAAAIAETTDYASGGTDKQSGDGTVGNHSVSDSGDLPKPKSSELAASIANSSKP